MKSVRTLVLSLGLLVVGCGGAFPGFQDDGGANDTGSSDTGTVVANDTGIVSMDTGTPQADVPTADTEMAPDTTMVVPEDASPEDASVEVDVSVVVDVTLDAPVIDAMSVIDVPMDTSPATHLVIAMTGLSDPHVYQADYPWSVPGVSIRESTSELCTASTAAAGGSAGWRHMSGCTTLCDNLTYQPSLVGGTAEAPQRIVVTFGGPLPSGSLVSSPTVGTTCALRAADWQFGVFDAVSGNAVDWQAGIVTVGSTSFCAINIPFPSVGGTFGHATLHDFEMNAAAYGCGVDAGVDVPHADVSPVDTGRDVVLPPVDSGVDAWTDVPTVDMMPADSGVDAPPLVDTTPSADAVPAADVPVDTGVFPATDPSARIIIATAGLTLVQFNETDPTARTLCTATAPSMDHRTSYRVTDGSLTYCRDVVPEFDGFGSMYFQVYHEASGNPVAAAPGRSCALQIPWWQLTFANQDGYLLSWSVVTRRDPSTGALLCEVVLDRSLSVARDITGYTSSLTDFATIACYYYGSCAAASDAGVADSGVDVLVTADVPVATDVPPATDAGSDASSTDAVPTDAGSDAGTADASTADAVSADAMAADASMDGSMTDGGSDASAESGFDVSSVDAGAIDGSTIDGGTMDASMDGGMDAASDISPMDVVSDIVTDIAVDAGVVDAGPPADTGTPGRIDYDILVPDVAPWGTVTAYYLQNDGLVSQVCLNGAAGDPTRLVLAPDRLHYRCQLDHVLTPFVFRFVASAFPGSTLHVPYNTSYASPGTTVTPGDPSGTDRSVHGDEAGGRVYTVTNVNLASDPTVDHTRSVVAP